MNHMKEVAQLLGVELEEEFEIKGDAYPYHYKYKLTEECLKHSANGIEWYAASATIVNLLNGQAKVVKIPKPVLDDVEKEYLSTVIKPFRHRIKYFFKFPCANGDYEAIAAVMKGREYYDNLSFPKFKKGSMYKGMELIKGYSVEELGI